VSEPQAETITFAEAIASCARLLRAAEMECDLKKMERYEALADSWVCLARLLADTLA
jgi:hypothetical protein